MSRASRRSPMKTQVGLAVWVCTVAFLAQAADKAEVKIQDGTGEAAVVAGDEATAKEEAKKRALRDAVEKAAGVMISSDTLTKNSVLLSDRIFSNSAGYIKKYDVVSFRVEKSVATVTVRAEIVVADLDRDLKAVEALIRRLGNRKLVILLQEQVVDEKVDKKEATGFSKSGTVTTSGVMATVLTDAFKKDGWTIVDPAFAQGKLKVASGVSLSTPEAKEIGDLSKADYILYGTVNLQNKAPSQLFKNAPAFFVAGEYDLSVFSTDSGSQLAKVSGKLAPDDPRMPVPAISYERAALELAQAKGPGIVQEVRKAVIDELGKTEQARRLVVSVLGLADVGDFDDFKEAVSKKAGTGNEATPGTFASGKGQFEIMNADSTGHEIAKRMRNAKFKTRKVTVTGVTSNTLELTVGK